MYRKLILFVLILIPVVAFSQAGTGVYQFLDLPVSSRSAALGGANVSLRDNDLNFAFQNPALLSGKTNNMIGLNMANYLADIKFGSAIYSFNIDDENFLAYGIQYVDYGLFKEATDLNEIIGTFTAKDMALNVVYARPLNDHFTVGATFKPVYSVYERYSSFGVAFDAGISYIDSAGLFSAGLVLRNMGTQLKGYYSVDGIQHYEPLPFEIQLGLSKKLDHAPLRFSLTFHNLQTWDLSFGTTVKKSTTERDNKDGGFFDMAMRHAIVGVEFVPTQTFYLAASYHHRRHQEFKMSDYKSMAGFSFGGGIRLYKFQVGFGMSQFQVGNYSYLFSIGTSLDEFRL